MSDVIAPESESVTPDRVPPVADFISSPSQVTIMGTPNITPSPLTPEQEQFINHFSWGLLFLGWIHFLATNLVGKAFCMFIPFYNIYLYFTGIFRARRMSWATGEWVDFAQFEKRQRLMDKIGIIFVSFFVVIFLLMIALGAVMAWMSFGDANGPAQVTKTFINNISQNRLDVAYLSTSQAFQKSVTQSSFNQFAPTDFPSDSDVTINSVKVSDDQAITCGYVTDNIHGTVPLVIHLVKETPEKAWKVQFMSSDESDCEFSTVAPLEEDAGESSVTTIESTEER